MGFLTEAYAYLSVHWPVLLALPMSVLGLLELAVRLTPTTRDDGFIERLGKKIRAFYDSLYRVFPNLKKGGGTHPKLKDK
jgi:hypothetical protein